MFPVGKKKRVIKRRKRGTGPQKMYFGPDVQEAIVIYNDKDSEIKRIENTIHVIELNQFEELIEEWEGIESIKEAKRQKRIKSHNARAEKKIEEGEENVKMRVFNPIEINKEFVIVNYLTFDYLNHINQRDEESRLNSISVLKERAEQKRKEKDSIYLSKIQPAFDKMVENLIFIYSFSGTNETHDELKNDTIYHLYSTMPKYDHTRGFKAFSYFNMVAKNHLIVQSKKRVKNLTKNVSIHEEDSMEFSEKKALVDYCTLPSADEMVIQEEDRMKIYSILETLKSKVKKENEILAMDAICDVFSKSGDIEIFKKKAIFHLLRENSGLETKQLNSAVSAIQKHYRLFKKEI